MKTLVHTILCLMAFFLTTGSVNAQMPTTDDRPKENIQIIVTTNAITLDTNFAGRNVYIAGVLENADPQLRRQGRYDIIVVMEGPIRPMVMREKKRTLGVWVNADALTFVAVPQSYIMATTREIRDITTPINYKRLGLGLEYLPLRADDTDEAKVKLFRDELIKIKQDQHLYSENIGAVTFGSASLFSANFKLPANIPVGHHTIHAYLFRDGEFVETVSTELEIVKAHTAYAIYRFAHDNSIYYGFVAVFIAIFTGILGRLIFRKD
ncbi:TIGR02186 family protein [uncultured Bartonella sp.]|uniref:TIGR02186 family protein n=1 Tax=uncultured Bartonella sp. TaxID=104108 RepID=UPI0025FB86C1|nr:TIGR02186 family protein [uncultured Bartonella sp.]